MIIKKIANGLVVMSLLLGVACKKDEGITTTVLVSTSELSEITSESANATGDVDVVGEEAITERGFVIGTDPKPTTANTKFTAGSGKGNFTAKITGLTSGNKYHVRAYVINKGQTYYGNDEEFEASTPIQLITNGGFTEPDDNVKYNTINAIQHWKSDETTADWTGREYDPWRNQPAAYMNDYAKSIYQVVGTVPPVKSDYAITFDANWIWTDWGDYDPTIQFIFSAYSGTDPTTRERIGVVDFRNGFFPGWQDNWTTKTGTFSIPAGSPHAGKNLVIEIDVLPYDGPYDPNMWFNFDNISVIQTLK